MNRPESDDVDVDRDPDSWVPTSTEGELIGSVSRPHDVLVLRRLLCGTVVAVVGIVGATIVLAMGTRSVRLEDSGAAVGAIFIALLTCLTGWAMATNFGFIGDDDEENL